MKPKKKICQICHLQLAAITLGFWLSCMRWLADKWLPEWSLFWNVNPFAPIEYPFAMVLVISQHFVIILCWPIYKPAAKGLSHSCLEVTLTNVVWTYNIPVNNFGLRQKFPKYLKESYGLSSDQHPSFKCFLKNALFPKMLPKLSGPI